MDRRARETVISPKGKAMTDRIDAARERMGQAVFADWDTEERDVFVKLLRRFADAMERELPSSP